VAIYGFAGYTTAATAVVPDAVTVMHPFHVVALAGAKLDLIRQRIQQQTLGRRGHTGDPALRDSARRPHPNPAALDPPVRPPHRGARRRGAPRGQGRLADLSEDHRCLRRSQPARGKDAMTRLIDSIRRGCLPGWRRSPNSAALYGAAALTSWRSSTTTPPTGRPKPSTDGWKHCDATPSDSETSPTTAGAHYSTAAHSTHSPMHSELRRAGKEGTRPNELTIVAH
jgi:transposase